MPRQSDENQVLLVAPLRGAEGIQRVLEDCSLAVTRLPSYREALDLEPGRYPLLFWDLGQGNAPFSLYGYVQEHFRPETVVFGYSLGEVDPVRSRTLDEILDWYFENPMGMETLFRRCVRLQMELILGSRGSAPGPCSVPMSPVHQVDDLWFEILARMSDPDPPG